MLTGLIFATNDADDRPETLTATLRFGGMTLFEYQARLLIEAGAGQILVAVRRVTPELLGAINRTAKRGVAVDIVRSAAEAAATVHPLARVVVIADGLVTNQAILGMLTGEGGEAVLVTDDADAATGFERVDARFFWAGIARIDVQRLAEAAALPGDYDLQSTLLRVAVQSGVRRLDLPAGAVRAGHVIERDSKALTARGKLVFVGLAAARPAWVDRYVFAPLSRLVLPPLLERDVPTVGLAVGGGAAAVIGSGMLMAGWLVAGLCVGMLGVVVFGFGSLLSRVRGDERHEHLQDHAASAAAALLCLLTGLAEDSMRGTMTGLAVAVALVIAATLVERAASPRTRRRWWGSPAAYPLLLIPFAAAGFALAGLGIVGLYAAVTLSAAIEGLREKP